MSGPIDLTNFIVAVSGLTVIMLGLLLTLLIRHRNRRIRRFFLLFFSLLLICVTANLLSQLSLAGWGPRCADFSRAAFFLESLSSSLVLPLLTLYLLDCTGGTQKSGLLSAAAALWGAYFILLIAAQFSSVFYRISPDNAYHRGPWYPLLSLPLLLLIAVNLFALHRRRRALAPRQCWAFAVYLLVPFVCILLQMASSGLFLIALGTSVFALFMSVFILTDLVEQFIQKTEENACQRASIMVLQMRPHFIYNTMMSIYYLCQQDPQRAQQVIWGFTSYLQKNFTAIVKEKTIPFTEELEHTQAYLAVEQVRFAGQLFVAFDTPHTAFRIPPLTLQPIVENAVKHGVDPELAPLRIAVYTRKTDKGSQIIVEDTGPGFEPADDEAPHTALNNIQERLALMCSGKLIIADRPGGGTVVTVEVPEEGGTGASNTP